MRQWSWGFHTVRGGTDPEDHRFRPRFVEAVNLRKYISSGHETLSSSDGAGSCQLLWLVNNASSVWFGFGLWVYWNMDVDIHIYVDVQSLRTSNGILSFSRL